jgi:hypothetical protein
LNFPVDITITGPTFARVKATTQQSFIGGSTPFTTNLFPPEGLSPGVLDFITFSSGVPVDVTFEIFFNHKSSELNPGSGTFNLQYALEDLEVIPLGGDSEFLFEGFTINFCRAAEPPIPSPLP